MCQRVVECRHEVVHQMVYHQPIFQETKMAEKCNSWPRKDFWRHIGEALLKVRQLNVVLEEAH
jgi:hypothetical protein